MSIEPYYPDPLPPKKIEEEKFTDLIMGMSVNDKYYQKSTWQII